MLLLETRRLRAMFSEIAEHYVANTEGKIASVTDAIEARTLSTEKIDGMLKAVRALTVKPQKGRRKDLSRIEDTLESLLKALEE
jgi:predicted RNA-binding protein with RPS1 domain